jgi:hypothetical protein
MEHMKWESSAKSRTCSKMRRWQDLVFHAKRMPWLAGMIRSQKCNLSRGDECEDCRGLVEPEDKPQLGRRKEHGISWSCGVPWRLTRAGVWQCGTSDGELAQGLMTAEQTVDVCKRVIEVGDTFNGSVARMDVEGD